MDPNGGINPSAPRLDTPVSPVPQRPLTPQPAPVVRAPSIDGIPNLTQQAPVAPPTPLPVGFSDMPIGEPAQPDVEEEKQSSGTLKKVLLILGGTILILGLAGGAYYLGLTTGQAKGQKEAAANYQLKLAELQKDKAESTDATDATDADTAKLDLGSLQDPKYIDETVEGEIGKQVSASDGLVLKVTNIERNFKSTDANYKLDTSKELVKVNFLIGNAAKDKPKDISSFNFRLENSSGAQLTPENIASYPDKFDTVKLDVGAQSKGSIVYAVNKNEKPLKFTRSQTYRISGQNKEVTTKISINIAK